MKEMGKEKSAVRVDASSHRSRSKEAPTSRSQKSVVKLKKSMRSLTTDGAVVVEYSDPEEEGADSQQE